jgi:hypothetical protein
MGPAISVLGQLLASVNGLGNTCADLHAMRRLAYKYKEKKNLHVKTFIYTGVHVCSILRSTGKKTLHRSLNSVMRFRNYLKKGSDP